MYFHHNNVCFAEILNTKLLPKLHTKLAATMASYKRYPDHYDYDRVAKEVIKKHPFLKCPFSDHVSEIFETACIIMI